MRQLYGISDILIVPFDASEQIRTGSAGNPAAFRPGTTSPPVIGQVWDPFIDHTTFVPTATADLAFLSNGAVDVPLPGLATGNLLVDPSFVIPFATSPGMAFAIPVPHDPLAVGLALTVQGCSLNGGTPGIHFANAIDIVIGTR